MSDSAPSMTSRQDPSDYGFAQGTVKAWDAVAGTNTVRVRGRDCENIMVLIGSEAGLVRVDDPVICMRINNTYAVIGRLGLPGADQRALDLQKAWVIATETSTNSAFGNLATFGPSITVDIGSSRRCLVYVSARVQVDNSSAEMAFEVTGESEIAATAVKPLTAICTAYFLGSLSVPVMLTAADGLQAGINTFTAKYRRPTGANASFGDRSLIVLPY